ncbi:MAG: 2TM domain-containing protein [Flavobacteriaceae bacterium]
MELMEEQQHQRYQKALKIVKRQKAFYRHLIVYLVIMMALFVMRYFIFPKIGYYYEDQGFKDWLNWNTYGLAAVWLIAIIIQGIVVFKSKTISNWEENKIQEILSKEEINNNQKWK